MMGGLSLNASGAALGSLFGVFEAARSACCDAGRQVEAQQGAGRSADAGARDRVGVGAPGCRTAAVACRPWAGVRVRRSTRARLVRRAIVRPEGADLETGDFLRIDMRFYIRFYPHQYMQPQCALCLRLTPPVPAATPPWSCTKRGKTCGIESLDLNILP